MLKLRFIILKRNFQTSQQDVLDKLLGHSVQSEEHIISFIEPNFTRVTRFIAHPVN